MAAPDFFPQYTSGSTALPAGGALSFPALFEEQAARTPQVGVEEGTASLTYAELRSRARGLARILAEICGGPEECRVVLAGEEPPEACRPALAEGGLRVSAILPLRGSIREAPLVPPRRGSPSRSAAGTPRLACPLLRQDPGSGPRRRRLRGADRGPDLRHLHSTQIPEPPCSRKPQ